MVIACNTATALALPAIRAEFAAAAAELSITGVVEPSTGLQSKFSTLHSAAVALIDGAAGTAQYSDARASDPAVAASQNPGLAATPAVE